MNRNGWQERFEEHRSAPARGRVSDARLAERGRRRGPGSLAAAQPHRHERGREPRRLADHRRRTRLTQHAAHARRGGRSRSSCTCPNRSWTRRTGATPSTRRSWPTRWGSRCSSCWRRSPRPNGWHSCYTTSSRCPSTRSRRSSNARPRPRDSSPAARAAASRAENTVSDPDLDRSARSSRRSSPPRGTATSTRCSPCSIRMSWCVDFGAAGGSREVRGARFGGPLGASPTRASDRI